MEREELAKELVGCSSGGPLCQALVHSVSNHLAEVMRGGPPDILVVYLMILLYDAFSVIHVAQWILRSSGLGLLKMYPNSASQTGQVYMS
jgi:hypothetical protein